MPKISVDGYEPRHLSYSTINGYRMCGKKFELQKVLRLEEKPGLAALGGNAVHTASERVDELIEEFGFEYFEPQGSDELDNLNAETEE